mmetsp:Transcript_44248/g.87785  ORF Transcript_44248/g.87785 Transcript_44248/m.87785 type:complete len:147 (-) Transcript_44248:11-451(-)
MGSAWVQPPKALPDEVTIDYGTLRAGGRGFAEVRCGILLAPPGQGCVQRGCWPRRRPIAAALLVRLGKAPALICGFSDLRVSGVRVNPEAALVACFGQDACAERGEAAHVPSEFVEADAGNGQILEAGATPPGCPQSEATEHEGMS